MLLLRGIVLGVCWTKRKSEKFCKLKVVIKLINLRIIKTCRPTTPPANQYSSNHEMFSVTEIDFYLLKQLALFSFLPHAKEEKLCSFSGGKMLLLIVWFSQVFVNTETWTCMMYVRIVAQTLSLIVYITTSHPNLCFIYRS